MGFFAATWNFCKRKSLSKSQIKNNANFKIKHLNNIFKDTDTRFCMFSKSENKLHWHQFYKSQVNHLQYLLVTQDPDCFWLWHQPITIYLSTWTIFPYYFHSYHLFRGAATKGQALYYGCHKLDSSCPLKAQGEVDKFKYFNGSATPHCLGWRERKNTFTR